MKSYREEYWFNIPGRRSFVNITTKVEETIKKKRHSGRAGTGKRHAYYGIRIY